MKCPYCNHDELKVIDKRSSTDDEIRRRRECITCGKRFTTYEHIQEVDLTVLKKDGSKEKFDRNKLLGGILKACEKRPVSAETIEQAVSKIESELRRLKSREIPSKLLGEKVIKKLKSLDKIAYIRFASVYREFEDLDRFEEELEKLQKK